jgi:hypothetical protein
MKPKGKQIGGARRYFASGEENQDKIQQDNEIKRRYSK